MTAESRRLMDVEEVLLSPAGETRRFVVVTVDVIMSVRFAELTA